VEGDLSCLDFSVLGIDLIANKDDRDIFTDSSQILVPFGNVLVSDSSSDIEHHDSSMSANTERKINQIIKINTLCFALIYYLKSSRQSILTCVCH